MASYLKWGFGRQGSGFGSGSWFLGDVGLTLQLFVFFGGVVGLSPYLSGGVVGLSPHLCFLGVGGFFFNFVLFGWWWFYFDFLGDYFLEGNFFFGVLCWKFIYMCGESLVKFD